MSDEDKTVYVATRHSSRTVYHTRECSNYPDHITEWQHATAEAWGLSECKECSGEPYRNNAGRGAPTTTHE
jgi:hypothetical protein